MILDPLRDLRSSDHPLDLEAAARDLWPRESLRFWQGVPAVRPERVFWPRSEAEVVRILEEASRQRVPVVPYGAGSGVCGGAGGMPGAVVIDTKALDAIGPLDPVRRTVEVEAGVLGQHLEDWLNARGFTLGHSPSSIWCSTVGGWAAARSAGQFSSRYGVFEDMVLQLRVATPGRGLEVVGEDGTGGDDLLGMLLGSEGTLGVVTKARLRVWPLPEKRWMRGYRFPDLASALRAMRGLMQGELWPAVLRLYDPVDTRIGGRTKARDPEADEPEKEAFYLEWLRAVDRIPAFRRRALTLPLALPGLVNEVFGRIAEGCLLVVGWEGDAEVVDALSAAGAAVLGVEGEDLGAEPGERWLASRHHVSYKLMPIFERGGFADTMEVACRWSQIEPLYYAIRGALGRTVVVMAHMSHLYPEGGSIYFSFAGRGSEAVYDRTWEAALQACADVGATVTHHHGVGVLKARAASREVGPAVAGWRGLKRRLDPDGVMNPGRLYVEGPPVESVAAPALVHDDGLAQAPVDASVEAREKAADAEMRWPFTRLPGPPRWQRLPWQSGWVEVEGTVEGRGCRLGRGPRSAAGPDLRPWLAERSETEPIATFAVVAPGPRWMGEAALDRPWETALALVRSDLRPASLYVRDGRLRVGFRGPAAEALGAIASTRVPGGLQPVAWDPAPLHAGPLTPCAPDDPRAVAVSLSTVLAPEDGA